MSWKPGARVECISGKKRGQKGVLDTCEHVFLKNWRVTWNNKTQSICRQKRLKLIVENRKPTRSRHVRRRMTLDRSQTNMLPALLAQMSVKTKVKPQTAAVTVPASLDTAAVTVPVAKVPSPAAAEAEAEAAVISTEAENVPTSATPVVNAGQTPMFSPVPPIATAHTTPETLIQSLPEHVDTTQLQKLALDIAAICVSRIYEPADAPRTSVPRTTVLESLSHSFLALQRAVTSAVRQAKGDVIFKCQDQDDAHLDASLRRRPEVTVVELQGCASVTDKGVQAIALHCRNLTRLSLEGCDHITDAGITAVSRTHPHLSALGLEGCDQLTDTGLVESLTQGGSLVELNLAYCDQITDRTLIAVGAHCPFLQKLNVRWCDKIGDTGLDAVAKNCMQMCDINLASCYNLTDAGVGSLARHATHLTAVNLSYCDKLTPAGLLRIAESTQHLAVLALEGLELLTDADVIKMLERMSGALQSLNLAYCAKLTDATVRTVSTRCPLVTALDLRWCEEITDAGVTALARCQNLTDLNLSCCNKITDTAILTVSRECTGLANLDVQECDKISHKCVAQMLDNNSALKVSFTDPGEADCY